MSCYRLKPDIHMNPILLKPHGDKGGQVNIHGRVYGNMPAADYHLNKFGQWLIEDVRKDKGVKATPLQNRRVLNYGDISEDGYKRLAETIRTNLDMERIYKITGLRPAI